MKNWKKSRQCDKSPNRRSSTGHVIKIKHIIGAKSDDNVTCDKLGLHNLVGLGSDGGHTLNFIAGKNKIALPTAHACAIIETLRQFPKFLYHRYVSTSLQTH
jgi:hypothetical protein